MRRSSDFHEITNESRRRFLKAGVALGGGLILGVHLPQLANAAAAAAPSSRRARRSASFEPNAFVRIGADESVTVLANHSEMGQGTYTALSMLVCEELEADWKQMRVESAPVGAAYNHTVFNIQMTGGSTSTWSEWERLRKAGASARVMLIEAAAEQWSVEPSSCHADAGFVIHPNSGRRASFGSLVDAASRRTPPQDVALKTPEQWKVIGRSMARLDTPSKTDGSAKFGLDVSVPGMVTALVARPPVFGGKAKSFDARKARAVKGVIDVVAIARGVAVVADGFWAAKRGRELLHVEWDEGPHAALDSDEQGREYAALSEKHGVLARLDGKATLAIQGAAKSLQVVYELPYLAHAPMEPLNCVADVRLDGPTPSCEIWTGTQFQTGDHAAAAAIAGLKPEQVKLHTMLLGGGFGRRAVGDAHFVSEAVELSKKLGKPVKVVWTREDDLAGGYYRPRALHVLRGGVDAAGAPVAWQQRVVVQSFIIGSPFEAFLVHDGLDEIAVEGAKELPYALPNVAVDWQRAPDGVPCLWWRSVGHSHTCFAVESFLDELAHAGRKDPLELRRTLLAEKPRHLRLLDLLAEKSGWGGKPPEGQGRGVALHESFGALVGHVIDASAGQDGRVRVHRVVSAVDCGPVVNPDGVKAQIEGGIVFGLSAALYGEITFRRGRVQQTNFHDYRLLRMHEMPTVEVHVVPSDEKMGGVGEPGVPPVAPALTNALFAATGKRVRSLPIRPSELASHGAAR